MYWQILVSISIDVMPVSHADKKLYLACSPQLKQIFGKNLGTPGLEEDLLVQSLVH